VRYPPGGGMGTPEFDRKLNNSRPPGVDRASEASMQRKFLIAVSFAAALTFATPAFARFGKGGSGGGHGFSGGGHSSFSTSHTHSASPVGSDRPTYSGGSSSSGY